MFKRFIVAVMILTATIFSTVSAESAKSDQWLIYWYVCGTDIETTRIAFKNGTDLMTGEIGLAEPDREPGDATRCIKEVEKAELSPNVKIFMQAGGTYVWGHEKFRDLYAKIQTNVEVIQSDGRGNPVQDTETGKYKVFRDTVLSNRKVNIKQWFLTGGGGNTVATPIQNGKIGRYVYDKDHRNWYPREQLPASTIKNTTTDMGSMQGFVSFLQAGQKLEQELYPDGNVRRVLIFVDHGDGINGVCIDEYTKNLLSLKEIQDAFKQVKNGWTNSDEKPFEVVAFDACIMSVYETAVAVENAANYMVASQESTFGKVMFGYTKLLNELSKNPAMSGKELGKVICNATWEDSKVTDKEFGFNSNVVFTESVIDLSKQKMDALKTTYANFSESAARVAKENPDEIIQTFTKFKNAANVSERFSILGGTPNMVDLKNFAENSKSNFPELKEASNELAKAIDNSVVYKKRGSAYKSGGGLSIYYPFNLIYSKGSIENYKTVTEQFSPKTQGELYDYLFEGVTKNLALVPLVDSRTQKVKINPATGEPVMDWAIPENSIFNLSKLADVNVEVDENKKTASIELDEDQQKGVDSVRYQLVYFVPHNNGKVDAVLLGNNSEVEENRQEGTFKIDLNGKKWVTLDGVPLFVQVDSDSTRKNKNGKKVSGKDMCISYILLNDKPYKLFFSRNYPSEKITVIGVVPTDDGNESTLPSGQLESLKKGDVVVPLYVYVTEETAEISKPFEEMTIDEQIAIAKEIFRKGKAITIGEKPKIEMSTLYNGHLGYMFEFVNPIGVQNTFTDEGAACKLKDGKIVKVVEVDFSIDNFSEIVELLDSKD